MKRIALVCGLFLSSCSGPTDQVSIKVESERALADGGSVERSMEMQIGGDRGQPAEARAPAQEEARH